MRAPIVATASKGMSLVRGVEANGEGSKRFDIEGKAPEVN